MDRQQHLPTTAYVVSVLQQPSSLVVKELKPGEDSGCWRESPALAMGEDWKKG